MIVSRLSRFDSADAPASECGAVDITRGLRCFFRQVAETRRVSAGRPIAADGADKDELFRDQFFDQSVSPGKRVAAERIHRQRRQ